MRGLDSRSLSSAVLVWAFIAFVLIGISSPTPPAFSAGGVQFALSAPNAVTSSVSGAGTVTESFDYSPPTLPASSAVGTYTTTGSVTINSDDVWGGSGSQYLGIGGTSSLSVTLANPARYVGFWWGAGDSGNVVDLYAENGSLLASFSTSTVTSLLSGATLVDVNGVNQNSADYKRGNAAGQPFAYVNLQLDDKDLYFSKVVFSHSPSSPGFELDNITVSPTWGEATAATRQVLVDGGETSEESGGELDGGSGEVASSDTSASVAGDPAIALELRRSVSQPVEGMPIEIAGLGLPPGTPYTLSVYEPEMILDSGVASGGGSFGKTLRIPALPAGTHTVVLKVVLPSGGVLQLSKAFEVGVDGLVVSIADTVIGEPVVPIAPEKLAYTGVAASQLPLSASVMLLFGLLLVIYSLRARAIVLEEHDAIVRTPWEILATPIRVPGIDYTPGRTGQSSPSQTLSEAVLGLDMVMSRIIGQAMLDLEKRFAQK